MTLDQKVKELSERLSNDGISRRSFMSILAQAAQASIVYTALGASGFLLNGCAEQNPREIQLASLVTTSNPVPRHLTWEGGLQDFKGTILYNKTRSGKQRVDLPGENIAYIEGGLVYPIANGRVWKTEMNGISGIIIWVDHGTRVSVYAHSQSLIAIQGQYVTRSTPILLEGKSGERSQGLHHVGLRVAGAFDAEYVVEDVEGITPYEPLRKLVNPSRGSPGGTLLNSPFDGKEDLDGPYERQVKIIEERVYKFLYDNRGELLVRRIYFPKGLLVQKLNGIHDAFNGGVEGRSMFPGPSYFEQNGKPKPTIPFSEYSADIGFNNLTREYGRIVEAVMKASLLFRPTSPYPYPTLRAPLPPGVPLIVSTVS